jgi:hypothetical protein
MKPRLTSTMWALALWTTVSLFGVLGLAYFAGVHSNGASLLDGPASRGVQFQLLEAVGLALSAVIPLMVVIARRVVKPVEELALFSERFSAGDTRSKLEITTQG